MQKKGSGPKHAVTCQHCGAPADLVTGKTVYPHREDLYAKPFWYCAPCSAWVGCHPGTTNPLGRPSNYYLRRAKSAAHAAFDPLWRQGTMRRKDAYLWLSIQLGIPWNQTHIGEFDEATCRLVVEKCMERGKSANG